MQLLREDNYSSPYALLHPHMKDHTLKREPHLPLPSPDCWTLHTSLWSQREGWRLPPLHENDFTLPGVESGAYNLKYDLQFAKVGPKV